MSRHWDYEKEYRLIATEDYFQINGKVSALFLGIRVKTIHRELILKIAGDRFPVYSTKINQSKVFIEKDQRLN